MSHMLILSKIIYISKEGNCIIGVYFGGSKWSSGTSIERARRIEGMNHDVIINIVVIGFVTTILIEVISVNDSLMF